MDINISLTKTSLSKSLSPEEKPVPSRKVLAFINSTTSMHRDVIDNTKFYLTYIKPISDLWLTDTDLISQITEFESQVLKVIGNITCTASIIDTYKHLR